MTEVLNDMQSPVSDETMELQTPLPENSLKRNPEPTASDVPVDSDNLDEILVPVEAELRQMHDEAKEANEKVHERARKTLHKLLPVILKLNADDEFRARMKVQVAEAYPSWKFDRNPVLAIVKYAMAAESVNAQKLAQKHASVLKYFVNRGLSPAEANSLLHHEGIEKLASGSRNNPTKKKPVHQNWDIRVSVSDELAEQIRLAQHGEKVQAVGIVILKDGETPSCEFRPLPE